MREAPPFTHTVVDFEGPLFIKTDSNQESKVWICLYSGCVTQAIHLDLVSSLTTQSFLKCFKRFVARRGLPQKIVSDNGKTFKSAAKTIKAITNHPEVTRQLAKVKVEWIFNVERAPWWGGLLERMVRSPKCCLRQMIGRAKLPSEELITLPCLLRLK